MKTRLELDALIDGLDWRLPYLVKDVAEHWRMEEFARHADPIMEQAGPDDWSHTFDRLEAMAVRHGLIELPPETN
jgi:hypothetical protein